MGWYDSSRGWEPYVSVAKRRQEAAKKIKAMLKRGEKVSPVVIESKSIATTFWGKAWCNNLEAYRDYNNRLPRGRTYVRNGSVIDLKITPGKVKALVNGSSIYQVEIRLQPLPTPQWKKIIKSCAGKIDSLIELLQGKLSAGVMETVTSLEGGLFPLRKQISLKCDCPDSAIMCKHIAAALYGVGSRLDHEPELLFLLRQVDHMDLITKASHSVAIDKTTVAKRKRLQTQNLGEMFGIEVEPELPAPRKRVVKKVTEKKTTVKKAKTKKVLSRKKLLTGKKKK